MFYIKTAQLSSDPVPVGRILIPSGFKKAEALPNDFLWIQRHESGIGPHVQTHFPSDSEVQKH